MFHLDCFQNYPEIVRPERPLRFHEIMLMSAKTSIDDVEKVKRKLRTLLDIITEESQVDTVIHTSNSITNKAQDCCSALV